MSIEAPQIVAALRFAREAEESPGSTEQDAG